LHFALACYQVQLATAALARLAPQESGNDRRKKVAMIGF
jgi:hypothetical protein